MAEQIASVDELADRCKRHAEAIMRASGSSLSHYETRSKAAILMAVMDCIEEATRDGAARASQTQEARDG